MSNVSNSSKAKQSVQYTNSQKHNDSGKRAIGIEYTVDGVGGPVTTAKATKLVVISAGAFGSPSILERSGIGSSSILKKYGIPVIVDLPGVGENYQGMSIESRQSDPSKTEAILQTMSIPSQCAMRRRE